MCNFRLLKYVLRNEVKTLSSNLIRGVFKGGGALRAPLDFQSLKRKSTVAHHSNRKETKRKKEKEEYRFLSL